MNDWTTLTRHTHDSACWWCTVGHPAREFRDIRLLAVTTATGWTRPRAGLAREDVPTSLKMGHAPSTPGSLFFSAQRGATVACQKRGIYPRFDSAARLGQIPLIPGQIPCLIPLRDQSREMGNTGALTSAVGARATNSVDGWPCWWRCACTWLRRHGASSSRSSRVQSLN